MPGENSNLSTAALAEILWDYHHLNQPLEAVDAMVVLGSHDLRVAEYAAGLMLRGLAPVVVMSGGQGDLTRDWTESEAARFAAIARDAGVAEEAIWVEDQSRNTGENILFSAAMLRERLGNVGRVLLVQKPYMERRTYATAAKQWPAPRPQIAVTSPPIAMVDYPTAEISFDDVVSIMVGDFHRIVLYPSRGFQIPQPVSPEAQAAFDELVRRGYAQRLAE